MNRGTGKYSRIAPQNQRVVEYRQGLHGGRMQGEHTGEGGCGQGAFARREHGVRQRRVECVGGAKGLQREKFGGTGLREQGTCHR